MFEESFDAKSIDNKHFFLQKLNYIHLNSIHGAYKLINNCRDYEHGSASFYEVQQAKHFVLLRTEITQGFVALHKALNEDYVAT